MPNLFVIVAVLDSIRAQWSKDSPPGSVACSPAGFLMLALCFQIGYQEYQNNAGLQTLALVL